jgi:hypothetical protein
MHSINVHIWYQLTTFYDRSGDLRYRFRIPMQVRLRIQSVTNHKSCSILVGQTAGEYENNRQVGSTLTALTN